LARLAGWPGTLTVMLPVRSKVLLFVFEALGSLACGFYGNYIFFLFRDR
jgi:hypothetical protein